MILSAALFITSAFSLNNSPHGFTGSVISLHSFVCMVEDSSIGDGFLEGLKAIILRILDGLELAFSHLRLGNRPQVAYNHIYLFPCP